MSPGWRRRGPPAPFSGGTPGVALVTWKRACSRPHESPVFKAIDYGRLPKRDRRPDNRCVVTRLPFVHPIGAQALLSPVARRALANSEARRPTTHAVANEPHTTWDTSLQLCPHATRLWSSPCLCARFEYGSEEADSRVKKLGYCRVHMPSVPRTGSTWFRAMFETATSQPSFALWKGVSGFGTVFLALF